MSQAISTGRSIEGFFETAGDAAFTVKPAPNTIEETVDILFDIETGDAPSVTLLASKDAAKTAFDDFETASRAAQLVSKGVLDIYVADDLDHTPAFVSESTAMSLHQFGDETLLFTPDRSNELDGAVDYLADIVDDLEEFSLRTPAYETVFETFEEKFDEDARDDFETAVDEIDNITGDVDEVVLAILTGAKHDLLHYDIGKWAEDTGLASKATISREKQQLEETSYITTEKVPMDIGRPRQRLVLGSAASEDDTVVDLAESVESEL